jgi:16S rRNA A1518/A1519 N6-dimethyltransferase RsmA/KsgA/DIM1 with predicted DNA glycosylase/AP lyase activity
LYPEFARMQERRPTSSSSSGPMANEARARVLRNRRRQSRSSAAAPNDTTLESEEAPTDLQWWSAGDAKVEVVGNLPFSIATELLMRYAVDCSMQRGLYRFGRVPLHMFVQKEVAERLTATPSTPQFSRLSVLAQNFFRVAVRQTFTELTYFPRTEVLGCLVSLEPRVAPLVDVNASVLINFVDIVMKPGMRNQMVSKALNRCVPTEVALYMLQELRLDGSVLPAQLSTIEVSRMARMWQMYLETTNQRQHHSSRRAPVDDEDTEGSNNDEEAHPHDVPLHSTKMSRSSRSHAAADPFSVHRKFVDKEQSALQYKWDKDEMYARKLREKMGTREKK